MNYIAITEIRPLDFYPKFEYKEYNGKKLEELVLELGLIPTTPVQEPLKSFTTIKLTEETFKFIESVATIEVPMYGEKTYKINNISFNIYSEEEYETRFGKTGEY